MLNPKRFNCHKKLRIQHYLQFHQKWKFFIFLKIM